MSKFEHARAHYRIRYPLEVRPVLRVEPSGRTFPVVDCSEHGIRYSSPGLAPGIGDEVQGTIRFHGGEEVEIDGNVVRVHGGEVALHLTRMPIPWRLMFSEQKFLLQRYPLSLITVP